MKNSFTKTWLSTNLIAFLNNQSENCNTDAVDSLVPRPPLQIVSFPDYLLQSHSQTTCFIVPRPLAAQWYCVHNYVVCLANLYAINKLLIFVSLI